jgi:hypothetical protein
VTGEFKAAYIQIPLLLKLRIPIQDSPVRPVLYGGAAVGFESSCKVELEGLGLSGEFDCDDPLIDAERTTTDWSAVFGGGLDFVLSSVVINLDARYDLGLTNLNNETEGPGSIKNRTWTFMAGVGFPVK